MSKYVKELITQDLSQRLAGVHDAVLVNVVGLDANTAYRLRKDLREKNIHLLVIRNSLARRATDGTQLHAAFGGIEGANALMWGSSDFIALAKEATRLDKSDQFKAFATRGGVMDGERLTPERVKEISKWPSREEQLSLLLGQILSPGADLVGQLTGPGGQLASQIEKLGEEPPAAEPSTEEAAAP